MSSGLLSSFVPMASTMGDFISMGANAFLPKTYSQNKPIINALFGSSVPYAQAQEPQQQQQQISSQLPPGIYDKNLNKIGSSSEVVINRDSNTGNNGGGGGNSGGGGGGGGGGNNTGGGLSGDALRAYMLQQDQGRNPVDDTWLKNYLGQSSGPSDADLNSIYSGSLSAADTAQTSAEGGATTDIGDVNAEYGTQVARRNQEGADLLSGQETDQNKFNQVLRSALDDAIRAFNALQQQGNARFGGASSAGAATGELAQQEFFRQQGIIQQKGIEGTADFVKQRTNIKQFISNKIEDLDNWKNTTVHSIKQNLSDKLAEIQARRGDIEANKVRDRLAILQDARSKIDTIQASDKSFRQNLALAGVNQLQQMSGSTFTPQQIMAYAQDFVAGLPAQIGSGPVSTQAPTTYNPYAKKTPDEITALGTQ